MSRPDRRIRFALLLYGVTALCRVLVTLVEVFQRTKAVQPAEFAAGELLFASEPALRVALLVIASANAVLLLWCRRPATALAQGAAILDPLGTLLAGVLLFSAFLRSEERQLREPAAGAAWSTTLALLARLTPRAVLGRLPGLALWAVCGLVLFGAAEAWLSTGRHVGRLFAAEDFAAFLALGAAGSVISGARWALEIACLVLAIGAFARPSERSWVRLAWAGAAVGLTPAAWLTGFELPAVLLLLALFDRWCARDASDLRRAFAPSVVLALYVGVRLQGYLFGVLIDEIAALGLVPATYATLGPLAVLVAVWTHAGTGALVQRQTPRRTLEAAAAVALAFAFPLLALLVPALGRRTRAAAPLLRRAAVPVLLGILLATWALGELNYPILNDFSQVAQPVWAALLGVAAAALFLVLQTALLQRPPLGGRAAWLALGALLLASIGTWSALASRQGPRLVAAQHAKILQQMLHGVRFLKEPALVPLEGAPRAELASDGIVAAESYPRLPQHERFAERRPPIFFLLWDAARADHLSACGYARRTTPVLERLASEAIVFERAYANATATTVSVRHLFGGRYATRYMLASEHAPFFPGALVARGYDRLWINVHGSDYNGVSAEAFLRCQPEEARVRAAARFFPEYEEQEKTHRAIALLDAELEQRKDRAHPADGLFFYLHCAAMHFPWRRWEDSEDYGSAPEDLYDECIAHADRALGVLLDALRERGLYDDAILVLTADHGTGLGEHGKYGGFLPYEEQIRVPLVMKLPGFAARRVAAPVASLDVAPTLVSLFAPGEASRYEGWSLLSLAAGASQRLPRRYLFSFCAFEDALALIDLEQDWKLHLHNQGRYFHLYDLRADPGETRSLADRESERAEQLFSIAERFLRAGVGSYANPYHYRELTPR
ncbi:MAG: sulfatase [Planctomycetes bacterium]|nr:sulfatase [Planctomycetota bacterium]